jgi:hypothetical protein
MAVPITSRLIGSMPCSKVLLLVQIEAAMNGHCQPKAGIRSNQDLRFALGCAES